jgi:hypothetical protein
LIYVSNNGDDKPITISVPNQKWNYFAFSFFDSKVDVYINGTLERSVYFYGKPPIYNDVDLVSVGDESGVNGAICNIVYYNIPLTKTKITQIYNTYFMKNPPI